MRVRYTGSPTILPDLGPHELVSGDVFDVPDEWEDSLLRRADFERVDGATPKTELQLPAPREPWKEPIGPDDYRYQADLEGEVADNVIEATPVAADPEPDVEEKPKRGKKAAPAEHEEPTGDVATEDDSAGN